MCSRRGAILRETEVWLQKENSYQLSHILRIFTIPIAISVLVGCAPTILKTYRGPEFAKQQIAIVKGRGAVVITRFDEMRIGNYGNFNIHLLPRKRVLEVGYIQSLDGISGYYSKGTVVLELEAKAGHVYWFHSGRTGDFWRPHIEDITDNELKYGK